MKVIKECLLNERRVYVCLVLFTLHSLFLQNMRGWDIKSFAVLFVNAVLMTLSGSVL